MANYDQVALRLQHGMRMGGDTFFPVGYPALLALEYTIGGRHLVFVGIVQAVFGALTCLLVYELGLRFSRSPGLAFVAGAVAALRATAAAWILVCSLTAILVVTFAVFLADPRMQHSA